MPNPSASKPRRLRRFIIAASAIGVLAAGTIVLKPDLVEQGRAQLRHVLKRTSNEVGSSAGREIITKALDRLQWDEIARCTGTNDKKPVVVKVIRHKRIINLGSLRSIKLEIYRDGATDPTEITTIDGKTFERKATFRGRAIERAKSICGGGKIEILDLK